MDSFNPVQIGCRSLLARICQDVIRGIDRRTIAAQFQQAVVSMVVNVSVRARQEHGIDTVGLTGGVFQNIPLVDVLTDQLGCAGFKVLTHSLVPPGDGGLSLGQAVIARNRLRQLRSPEPQV